MSDLKEVKSREPAAAPRALAFHLKPEALIPNNRLPLLVYRRAFNLAQGDAAGTMERVFRQNGWGDSWRDSIYSYHHYHSTAHEVLGVFRGTAVVQFGGDSGRRQELMAGDAVVIPAGVAHKNLDSSDDFGVVGAYPAGQDPDICYAQPGERPGTDTNIARVPLPKLDPVFGASGPLLEHWTR